MDTHFPKTLIPFISLILFAFFVSSFPTVRSEPVSESDVILLPSQSEPTDVCSGLTRSQSICPVNCFRPDPVCGVDGVTYWCGCQDAQCAGVKVSKLGFCEVGSGGSAPHSAQALLLVHIVWLIVLGFSVLFGLF